MALDLNFGGAEELWRIVEPVVNVWGSALVPLHPYATGTSFEP